MKLSLVSSLLLLFLVMMMHESQAFPSLFSLSSLAERRAQGWLKPWRWLFSRKDEEDDDESEDSSLRSPATNLLLHQIQQQLPQLQQMLQPMASTQQVQHAVHPSMQQQIPHSMQQALQAHPHALSALDALGPGTFMNYGDDLIYVPFSSLKHFNGLSPEWMNLWGNMGNHWRQCHQN